MCCNSKDRAELDLYFRLACEPAELGPADAHEDRLRKEMTLHKRSPRAHQALVLARDTLRLFKPGDVLVLLPKTAVACLALLEALDAVPEQRLEILDYNPCRHVGHAVLGSLSGMFGEGRGLMVGVSGGVSGGVGAVGGSSTQEAGGVGGTGGSGFGPPGPLYAGGGGSPSVDYCAGPILDVLALLRESPQSDV